MAEIIDNTMLKKHNGCDFIINLPLSRKDTKIKLLQLTDMQIIDSSQRRTFDRLKISEINAWAPENFDVLCGNHIRALVAESNPDLIFITGDIVYGSFDDKGTTLKWFCSFMDSLKIPWAPTFGNHDNESKRGVDWQCAQFEKSKYCVFKRGNVSGNSNYTVGIAVGGKLLSILHLLDTNACILEQGIYPDQLELVKKKTRHIEREYGKKVPAFMAFHIPTEEFKRAGVAKGYESDLREFYTIGVDVEKHDDDFGCKMEKYSLIKVDNFLKTLKECNIRAVFAGHCHNINTCIDYEGIKWVFGLKTGQYDYHMPGQLGGTLISLFEHEFDVCHIPALIPYGPFPKGKKMFDGFFAEDKYITEGENND